MTRLFDRLLAVLNSCKRRLDDYVQRRPMRFSLICALAIFIYVWVMHCVTAAPEVKDEQNLAFLAKEYL